MRSYLKFAAIHVLGLVAESIVGTTIYLLDRGGPEILTAKNIGPMIVAYLTLVALQAQYLRPVFAMLIVMVGKRLTLGIGTIYFLMQILSVVFFMLIYRLTARDDFQFFTASANSFSQAFYLFLAAVVSAVIIAFAFRVRRSVPASG